MLDPLLWSGGTLARVLSVASLAFLIVGCATVEPASTPAPAAARGVLRLPNDPTQAPWVHAPIRFKTETVYRADIVEGVPCIRADAFSSWSVLAVRVPPEFAGASKLSWRWRTEALIPNATSVGMGRDDAPVRVLVGFKGDMNRVPAADRAAMNMAKLLGGWELPFASIQYLWEAEVPAETVIDHHTVSRIKKLVVRSGPAGLGEWLSFERDVREDYRRAFPGEEPGEIESIGIMTDTETLGGTASACYADITLR
ncbi:MAG: DUF3047 domain-containing protein [Casimicrobiaceae bacterium]|nr:DUF3047 domain-containing protein [Casimicrobiaceae bacterium]MDW8312718.1 DUF3047 domain-containing protein [Burkholderiales bacterium]